MKRVLFSLAVVATLGLLIDTASHRVSGADKDKSSDGQFVHAVIFYLKKDAPKDEAKALVTDAHEILAKIPTVRSVKAGPPAAKGTPKVGVTDYQVGLLVMFDNVEGLHTYLTHPMHLKYVEKHEKHIDKVLVYDFADGGK